MQQACQQHTPRYAPLGRPERVECTPHFGANATSDALRSSGFVDHVELCGRLEAFPRARKTCGDHEGIAGIEDPLSSRRVCDADASASDVAVLVLGVADAPATRRAFPDAAEEAPAAVAEVVARRVLGIAREQAIGRRLGLA